MCSHETLLQVEELQRQQQQQDELPQLSAEQLEQIRHQHKLLGLPPLNPQQLQYQLQEQQNQLLQAQIREQQLQEQQQQQQIQELDQGAVIMASSHPGLLQQLNTTQITSAPLSMAISSQPLSLPAQSILQLRNQTNEAADNRASISSQIALNTSVQQILAALDPSVVRAAGINLNDHQHLLEQLQKQQQTQQELLGLQVQSQVTGIAHPSGILSGLHISQIPQILLQPPDSDDMNGVPTISIPESVVLGSDSSSVMQANSEFEQEQIKRIQNGLMASQPKRQQEALIATHAHPSLVQTLESGMLRTNHLDQTGIPNFLNIQAPSTHSNLGSQVCYLLNFIHRLQLILVISS